MKIFERFEPERRLISRSAAIDHQYILILPMDSLAAIYSSESENETIPAIIKRPKVDLAPAIHFQDLTSTTDALIPSTANSTELTINVPYSLMVKPFQGPANPFVSAKTMTNKNTQLGFVEDCNMANTDFNELHRTFVNFGYTRDPDAIDSNGLVGDSDRIHSHGGLMASELKKSHIPATINAKRKRLPQGDAADIDGFQGPWAGFEGEQLSVPDRTAEQEADAIAGIINTHNGDDNLSKSKGSEKSVFYGKNLHDYQGRTYMSVPHDTGVDLQSELGSFECFLPKRSIHTWTGHTKGVNAIRFFPSTAHLLLSASMDSTVRLWDVYNDRSCLRSFHGHSKGIRDIDFNNSGSRFLSASYDKFLKLWDTETGQCISKFTTKRIPYCVKFNPDPSKQDIFLTGCQDKKIYQFDVRSGEIVQEYDQHLGAVNTITFVDDNRRFVTTSDDKTLRAWEVDIPVVIKYVAEPDMHSMPAVTLSQNKKWLACQSLDNQVLIYSARDRFRINRKKVFKGHLIAGYACQPNFSPDARYIMSGDSEGKLWFWDWKTCKVMKKINAHDGVVMGCAWHPHETSKVATCSWDGTIKYWD
ncbi:hypothetical protein BDV3_005997 [Batrachochytrium dendrobatidis]|nr:hypothetical protein QVD99_006789 [Batrachochytrium dendrobatidis]